MEAADTLYGVSMAGDGISEVDPSAKADAPAGPKQARPRNRPETAGLALMARDWQDLFILDGASAARRRMSGVRPAGEKARRPIPAPAREPPQDEAGAHPEIQATLFEDLSEETWERLEEALIYADVGAQTTARVVAQLEQEATGVLITGGEALTERLTELLAEIARTGDDRIDLTAKPTVILMAGVNGTGKTTTSGKLAWHLSRELGHSVVLAAADTFRAAAVEQLELWAQRAGATFVQPRARADPGSVAPDTARQALGQGRRRGDHRYRRPPAHPGRPDGRAGQGAPGDRQTDPRGATRDIALRRRHHRSGEQAPPSTSCSPEAIRGPARPRV